MGSSFSSLSVAPVLAFGDSPWRGNLLFPVMMVCVVKSEVISSDLLDHGKVLLSPGKSDFVVSKGVTVALHCSSNSEEI